MRFKITKSGFKINMLFCINLLTIKSSFCFMQFNRLLNLLNKTCRQNTLNFFLKLKFPLL